MRFVCCLTGLLLLALCRPSGAQDAGAPSTAAEQPPAAAAAEPGDAPQPGGAVAPPDSPDAPVVPFEQEPPEVQEFLTLLKNWQEERAVRSKAMQEAPNDVKRTELVREQQRWSDEIVPRLIDAGLKAYAAKPGQKTVEIFLAKMAVTCFESDQMEDAARISSGMILSGYNFGPMAVLAGRACLEIGNFEDGERWLRIAHDRLHMQDAVAAAFLRTRDETVPRYEAEMAIRAREAAADDLPRVQVDTSRGSFVVELFENEFPNAVALFVSLCERKYYDERPFYYVRRNYFALAGDKTGTGKGDAGYSVVKEFVPCTGPDYVFPEADSKEPWRLPTRGSFMLLNDTPLTLGSRFAVCYRSSTALTLQQMGVVIGRVISGLEYVTKLQERNPQLETRGAEFDRILKTTVLRKRDHGYAPVFTKVHVQSLYNQGLAAAKKLKADDNGQPLTPEQHEAQLQRAMEFWDFALQIQPGHTLTLYAQSVVYLGERRFTDAIACLERLLKREPNHLLGREQLVTAYLGANEYEKAIAQCREITVLDPKNAKAYNNLGMLYVQRHRPSEAEKAFKKALEIDPTYEKALRNLRALRQNSEANAATP
ncbi:MAG: peptidylprolyl isomerase [Pirellulales bacterium]|nr:peptidylprolyl isomerase [Pirellulales bacterium]